MDVRKITRIILLCILLSFTCFFVGCASKQFDSDYMSFKSSYMKVTEVLDEKDPFTSIQKLKIKASQIELGDMKNILVKMSAEISTEKEKSIYENMSKYYDALEFLVYAASNQNNLTEDERGRIATELTLISMNRNSIKRGEK